MFCCVFKLLFEKGFWAFEAFRVLRVSGVFKGLGFIGSFST